MKIINISVNSTDPKTMIVPAKDVAEEFGLDIDLLCWDSTELDEDVLKYQDLVKATKGADLIIMRCMTDPTRMNRFEKYEAVLKEAEGLAFIYSGNADVKFLYRDLFRGTDEEFIELGKYVGYRGAENDKGLILWLNRRLGGPDIAVPEPVKQRTDGIYHPDHPKDIGFEDYLKTLDPGRPTAGIMFTGNLWIFDNTLHIDSLIRCLESKGLNVIPVFFSATISSVPGERGTARLVKQYLMDGDASRIDVLIMASPFSQLVNSRETDGMNTPDEENFYRNLTNVPVLQAMTLSGAFSDYEESALGLNKSEIFAQVSWPEVDGQIITVPIGTSKERVKNLRKYTPIEDRIEHISELAKNWAVLRRTPVEKRKIAILLYQSRPESGRIGSAAGLDTLESVSDILRKMKDLGYAVENVPSNGKELINELLDRVTNNLEWTSSETVREKAIGLVDKNGYLRHFDRISEFNKNQIKEKWGEPIGNICVDSGKMVIPGVIKGNVLIGYQPLRAWFDQAESVCHDPIMPMPHQYLEYYRWLRDDFGVQMVVHVGTHGSLEWLPGKNVGLSSKCYPDLVLSSIPHMYPYVIDDPGEGIQAKRRSEAVLIGHMCPAMARSGSYDDLAPVEVPLQEYFKFKNSASPERKKTLIEDIYEAARSANLFDDIGLPADADVKLFEESLPKLHDYLTDVKEA
ncbi:MAG: cobaltochelatase subunit CobN, partial [Candidatus Methanoplasma sp.]|nr:cobaltochelatase subunit CobN [Candidatus Methanoplasma sp.]